MSKVESILNHWLLHRKVLIELLDTIPAEQVQFTPWEGAMSLGNLAVHMAVSADWFVNGVKNGRFDKFPGAPTDVETLEQVRAYVRDQTDKTALEFALLTDEQLDGVVDAKGLFGFDAPGKVFLTSTVDHEIHHKGQLFVYAREVGVEKVPFFISM